MTDTHKELRKTIIEVFRKFSMDPHISPLKKQKDREIAGRFIDRLHTTTFDPGILPYHSPNGLAKHTNKAECVFAMMCDVVLTYWCEVQEMTGKATLTPTITNKLKQLDTVHRTYEQLKVLGDEKGYCLLKSLRKDLYEKPKVEETQIVVRKDIKTFEGLTAPVKDSEGTAVGEDE